MNARVSMNEREREIDITNLENEFQELLESGSTIYLYKSKELIAILNLSEQKGCFIDKNSFIGAFFISMWSKEREYIGTIVFDKITTIESIWKGSCVNDK